MARMSYTEQLKHPNWQRVRLEKLAAAQWMCEHCFSDEDTLHVHHKQYFKGRMAWEYAPEELCVLCEVCHSNAHETDEEIKKMLLKFSPDAILCLLAGYFEPSGKMDKPFYWGNNAFHAGIIAKVHSELSDKAQKEAMRYLMKKHKTDRGKKDNGVYSDGQNAGVGTG